MKIDRKSPTASGSEASRPQTFQVLTKEQVGELLEAQRKLYDIQPALEFAAECGIDCKEQLADHATQSEQIRRLLQRFGGINP